MGSERKTLVLLIQFFSDNQDLIPRIIQNPSDVDVWDKIFVFFYGEVPIRQFCDSHPLKRRTGSNDPRWDELLHKKAAMKALRQFVENPLVVIP
jgi:hypothetical protein